MTNQKTQELTQIHEQEKALEKEITNRWQDKKMQNQILVSAYDALQPLLDFSDRKIDRIDKCGSFLEFHSTEDGFKLHNANFCKDRLCPMCQWRRSLKMFGQLTCIMDYMTTHEPYNSYRYAFLTLTVKNCGFEELSETIDLLLTGFKKLTHKAKIFKSGIVAGSFRSLEIIVSKDEQGWHPHLHVILALTPAYFERDNNHKYKNFMTQKEWSDLWAKCCGLEYSPVVDIRMIKSYEADKSSEKAMKKAIAEAGKYSVKGSQFLFAEDAFKTKYLVWILSESLKKRQLYAFTGCFRNVRKILALDDPDEGDLIHVDGEEKLNPELETMIVRYHWSAGGFYTRKEQ